jgi:hypothetical protein
MKSSEEVQVERQNGQMNATPPISPISSSIAQEAMDGAANVAEAEQRGEVSPQAEFVTLSSGIVLKTQPVNPYMLRMIELQWPEPQPPIVMIADKGREEPNPDDPKYIDDHQAWEALKGEAGMNYMLLAGTRVEHVPDGMYGPNDDDWLEVLDIIGLPLPTSERRRYMAWLRSYALKTAEDYLLAASAVARRTGVAEEDVQASAAAFPSGEVGRVDPDVPGIERSGDGDQVPSDNPSDGVGA